MIYPTMNRTVFGVGVNDADYMVRPIVNGKGVTCSYYQRWHSMIRRCYDPKYQEKTQHIEAAPWLGIGYYLVGLEPG